MGEVLVLVNTITSGGALLVVSRLAFQAGEFVQRLKSVEVELQRVRDQLKG